MMQETPGQESTAEASEATAELPAEIDSNEKREKELVSVAELSIEGYEGLDEKRQEVVRQAFGDLSQRFGISKELLIDLVDGQVELAQNTQGHEKMLAAFVWDPEDGRKLRIYDGAFLGHDGKPVSDAEARKRIDYLLGHELSHATINTGAVVDMHKLHGAITSGREGEDALRDHLISYMDTPGVQFLERHFTRDQALKYSSSGKASSEQWSFAQEVLAERFHEYQSAQGSKDDFIMRRLTGVDLAGYIVEAFPDKDFQRPQEGNEREFWKNVAQQFNIDINDFDPVGIYNALSSEGMPLEAIKRDIEFWHTTFSRSLGENPEQKISDYLDEQNQMELESTYEFTDEYDGDDQVGGWFDEGMMAGQMPQESNALGPEGGKVKTVPDKLFEIANMMAGISNNKSTS